VKDWGAPGSAWGGEALSLQRSGCGYIYIYGGQCSYPIQIGLRKHGGPQALPGGAKPYFTDAVKSTCEYSLPKVLFFLTQKNMKLMGT
jgi:hypothetical protein